MSILTIASAAASAPSSGETQGLLTIVVMAAALLLAVGAAFPLGVFCGGKVSGPLRSDPSRPLWPLGLAFALGMLVLVVMSGVCVKLPGKWIVATVPPALTFVFLVAADWILRRETHLRIGLTASLFLPGVGKGLLALLVVIPLMVFLSGALETLYLHVGYVHPAEHPLLKLMGEAEDPWSRWLFIAGAVLAAPFAEEYLFRGFLQTIIRQSLVTREAATQPPGNLPTPVAESQAGPSGLPVLAYHNPGVALPRVTPQRTWLAIILTALAFASIHPAWTAPLIFALALCLGYAYERTENLWTPITIHLGFNAMQTAWYLLSQRA